MMRIICHVKWESIDETSSVVLKALNVPIVPRASSFATLWLSEKDKWLTVFQICLHSYNEESSFENPVER